MYVYICVEHDNNTFLHLTVKFLIQLELECGPMPNVMVALPNTGGAL